MTRTKDRCVAKRSTFCRVGRPICLVFVLLFLHACGVAPISEPDFRLDLGQLKPMMFDVEVVDIVESYRSPLNDPYVEHLAPLSPAQAIRDWAVKRFRPIGKEGSLRITIVDASITGVSLDTNEDFKALFISEQGAELTGNFSINIEVLDSQQLLLGHVAAYATASTTLPEDASLRDRDYAMFGIVKSLVDALDLEVSAQADKYLQLFIH